MEYWGCKNLRSEVVDVSPRSFSGKKTEHRRQNGERRKDMEIVHRPFSERYTGRGYVTNRIRR